MIEDVDDLPQGAREPREGPHEEDVVELVDRGTCRRPGRTTPGIAAAMRAGTRPPSFAYHWHAR